MLNPLNPARKMFDKLSGEDKQAEELLRIIQIRRTVFFRWQNSFRDCPVCWRRWKEKHEKFCVRGRMKWKDSSTEKVVTFNLQDWTISPEVCCDISEIIWMYEGFWLSVLQCQMLASLCSWRLYGVVVSCLQDVFAWRIVQGPNARHPLSGLNHATKWHCKVK